MEKSFNHLFDLIKRHVSRFSVVNCSKRNSNMKNKTVDLFYGDNVRLNAHAINNNSPEEIINRFAVVPLNTIKSKQIRNIMVLVKDM